RRRRRAARRPWPRSPRARSAFAGLLAGGLLGDGLLRRFFRCFPGGRRGRSGSGRRCRSRSAAISETTSPALWLQRRRGEQLGTFGLGQRFRFAILRDTRVLLAVGDVGSVAAVEHLDRTVAEACDDAIACRLLFLDQQLLGARQFDRVRIVLGL